MRAKKWLYFLALLSLHLPATSAPDGYLIQDAPALKLQEGFTRHRIATILPKGTHIYDVEEVDDSGIGIYEGVSFPYSKVVTIDGLEVLVRDRDIKTDNIAQQILAESDFFLLRPLPLCEYPASCRDMKQQYPKGVMKGVDWELFLPMQVGFFTGEASDEYQPVQLTLSDHISNNKNFLLPLHLHGNFKTESFGYWVKKPYLPHPKYKVVSSLLEGFQSDCGEKTEDINTISKYLNASVGFHTELSAQALTAVLNFIGIKFAVDVSVKGGIKKCHCIVKSKTYGREDQKWVVKHIDVRDYDTNERSYTMILREVHECRANCSQSVLSVDATIIDQVDQVSEINLTREDVIKANIRKDTNDVNGLLTISNAQEYFNVLDYLQTRTKGDIPVSLLNIFIHEVNTGLPQSM